MPDTTHPDAPERRPATGELEQRSAPTQTAPPTLDGRRLRGVIPYGVESRDMGGWREIMARGSLSNANTADLVATVDHGGVPLARFPTTLEVEDRDDGLHWSLELPESRADVREAVERGDLRATSWRMVVGRDRWAGEVRHVEQVAELRDVSLVTNPAYSEARAEYRSAGQNPSPETEEDTNAATERQENDNMPDTLSTEDRNAQPDQGAETREAGSLQVEDRTAEPGPTVEERVIEGLRAVQVGESRSLSLSSTANVTPPELSSFLFERLRPASVALASGITVIPTDRSEVQWPKLSTDVAPDFYAEAETIAAGDPGFVTLTATPHKLAHRVEFSNEVADDSEPAVIDVLNGHLATMLGLKLDAAIFEGNPASNADSIRGLKYVAGIQTVDLGTNGAALADYDPFIEAVGKLQAANVPGPYVAVVNPRTATALALLKTGASGSVEQLPAPSQMPPVFTTSQLSTTEAKGTESDASSAYVYSPSQLVLVRRQDATVELDRSRLFDSDQSEVRGKLRADLLAPNPTAICRVEGIIPAA